MPEETNAQDSVAKVATATAPLWKKVLWWCLGGIAIGTLLTVLIVMLAKKNKLNEAINTIVDFTTYQIAKADLDAKIKTAEAEATEQDVIDKLKKIKEMPNEDDRNKALAALL